MQILNLRELYPDVYKTDVYLNVSDEVYAVFPTYKRAEAAYQRQVYRYKAQYSLDCDNGIENAVYSVCQPQKKCSRKNNCMPRSTLL